MTATLRSFDGDTALEPLGDGRFRAVVAEHWSIGGGPNGGFLAAVATRAMETVTGRPPRSLTLHYLEAPRHGPIEVLATVEREGRSTSFVSLRMSGSDGRPLVLGLGVASEWREGHPEWREAEMPDVPGPAEARPVDPQRTNVPAFMSNYDMRIALHDGRTGGWMRTAAPRAADAALLAALTDAWVPVAFLRAGMGVRVPTIDLTIHWRAPAPAGEHPFVLGMFTTRTAAGGVWEEDGELWSEEGTLLAQSRQLAIIRAAA